MLKANRLIIYPYKKFSQGARLLGKLLGAKLRYKPKFGKIINWGRNVPIDKPIINNPSAVNIASNKLLAFRALEGIQTVPWTTDKEVANGWLSGGKRVVVRSLLRASEGRGITIIEPGSVLPNAKLYTQYVPKKKEFRVHVVGNEVIDIQEKRRKAGQESHRVRVHDNGYVFCRKDLKEPPGLRELAINAVKSVGLDFAAVDIIWNDIHGKLFVLELNTAPGLTNTTGNFYSSAFRKLLGIHA
jgi:glutathione synthase/RimK-type ligase-like ATP-grasp enzyme